MSWLDDDKNVFEKVKKESSFLKKNGFRKDRKKVSPRLLFLEVYVKAAGFKVVRTTEGFRVCSEKIPSVEKVKKILKQLSAKECVFFWNYYHRTVSDPGSYISAYIEKGNAILMEGNHGWSSDYKKISTDDLVELIIRNWDKDWERNGDLKNAIHIQKENNPLEILSAMSNVSQVFVPNYNEAAW